MPSYSIDDYFLSVEQTDTETIILKLFTSTNTVSTIQITPQNLTDLLPNFKKSVDFLYTILSNKMATYVEDDDTKIVKIYWKYKSKRLQFAFTEFSENLTEIIRNLTSRLITLEDDNRILNGTLDLMISNVNKILTRLRLSQNDDGNENDD